MTRRCIAAILGNNMIRVENLTKSFGDRLLLDEISFSLAAKQRVGLVGQNGHGKTTLFQMINGEEQPDAGAVVIPKNYRIIYVQQHLEFSAATALEEGMRALPPQEQDHSWKVEKILAGLGFSEQDYHRHPSQFSGGLQVRLNLVKALVSEPDLLLLDEPTNFLDITSIRWIEQFLTTWPHELLLITHDRSFMDKVVTHTIGPNITVRLPRTKRSMKKPGSMMNDVARKSSNSLPVFEPRPGSLIWYSLASRRSKKWKKKKNSSR
jgi:ATP-binding cassette subfamily F protein 3